MADALNVTKAQARELKEATERALEMYEEQREDSRSVRQKLSRFHGLFDELVNRGGGVKDLNVAYSGRNREQVIRVLELELEMARVRQKDMDKDGREVNALERGIEALKTASEEQKQAVPA